MLTYVVVLYFDKVELSRRLDVYFEEYVRNVVCFDISELLVFVTGRVTEEYDLLIRVVDSERAEVEGRLEYLVVFDEVVGFENSGRVLVTTVSVNLLVLPLDISTEFEVNRLIEERVDVERIGRVEDTFMVVTPSLLVVVMPIGKVKVRVLLEIIKVEVSTVMVMVFGTLMVISVNGSVVVWSSELVCAGRVLDGVEVVRTSDTTVVVLSMGIWGKVSLLVVGGGGSSDTTSDV